MDDRYKITIESRFVSCSHLYENKAHIEKHVDEDTARRVMNVILIAEQHEKEQR